MEMVIKKLTVSLVYLTTWLEDGQAIPKSVYFERALDSSVTVLRSNRAVGFWNL
jgi:hypothetical protein